MIYSIEALEALKIATSDLLRDERALNRLHDNFIKSTQSEGFRRTQTTTYSARSAQAVERRNASRDALHQILVKLTEDNL